MNLQKKQQLYSKIKKIKGKKMSERIVPIDFRFEKVMTRLTVNYMLKEGIISITTDKNLGNREVFIKVESKNKLSEEIKEKMTEESKPYRVIFLDKKA